MPQTDSMSLSRVDIEDKFELYPLHAIRNVHLLPETTDVIFW